MSSPLYVIKPPVDCNLFLRPMFFIRLCDIITFWGARKRLPYHWVKRRKTEMKLEKLDSRISSKIARSRRIIIWIFYGTLLLLLLNSSPPITLCLAAKTKRWGGGGFNMKYFEKLINIWGDDDVERVVVLGLNLYWGDLWVLKLMLLLWWNRVEGGLCRNFTLLEIHLRIQMCSKLGCTTISVQEVIFVCSQIEISTENVVTLH